VDKHAAKEFFVFSSGILALGSAGGHVSKATASMLKNDKSGKKKCKLSF
jgi:hypothetical protein